MKTKYMIPVVVFFALCVPARRVSGASPASAGTGSVKGTVKFEGMAPQPTRINMAADPSCAKLHPTPVMTSDVRADATGDLEDVVVFVSDGLGDRTFDPPAESAKIEQKGCLYQPHVMAIRANQKLEVVNSDPTLHNIHPLPTNNREWNKAEPPNTTSEEAFSREEIAIPIKCNVHPWMRSYVAVFRHPFFAVTGKDGSFDLSGLPAGTYTIKAWHEKLGTSTQQVTINGSETKALQFVFRSHAGA